MLDSLKSFFKKPEFPDAPDSNSDSLQEIKDAEDYEERADIINTESEELEEQPSTDNPDSQQKKKTGAWIRTAVGSVVCLGGACLGFYWFVLSDSPRPAEIPQGDILASLAAAPTAAPPALSNPLPPAAPKTPLPASPPSAPAPEPAPSKPVQQTPAAEASVKKTSSGAFGANPFVDLSVLHTEASASGLGLPVIHGSGNMALPEIPRPVVSPELLPSPGEIRTPAAPAGAVSAPPSMGGVITKPNGESIAIMGDGTVLSEGDTYKGDRRVTFIGGDGITFDDGNTVPFGQNK